MHRRAAETEQFGHGDEITQMAQFHERKLIAFVYHAQSNKVLSDARWPLEGGRRSRSRNP
jgi:hypothetical protein